jgi:hypothetical protein
MVLENKENTGVTNSFVSVEIWVKYGIMDF